MSQIKIYKPAGALQVEAGVEYDYTNIPATCNVVELQMGVRLRDNTDGGTPLRGVRMTIANTLTPGANQKPNIPFIWIEGTQIIFDSAYTYKFHDNGVVGYGIEVTP